MYIAILVAGAIVAVLAGAVLRAARRRGRESVPAAEILGEAQRAPTPRRYTAQRLRILVVDDNPFIGLAVTRLLDTHDVTTASSGEAALSALAFDDGFDAILCALKMPGMSGVAFAAAIAERHPKLRSRVVFLLDGTSTPETRALLELSEIRCVTKPIGYAELATSLSEAAARRTPIPSRTVTPVRSASG